MNRPRILVAKRRRNRVGGLAQPPALTVIRLLENGGSECGLEPSGDEMESGSEAVTCAVLIGCGTGSGLGVALAAINVKAE